MVTLNNQEDINIILNALGEVPLKTSYATFNKIVAQLEQRAKAAQQVQAAEVAPTEAK